MSVLRVLVWLASLAPAAALSLVALPRARPHARAGACRMAARPPEVGAVIPEALREQVGKASAITLTLILTLALRLSTRLAARLLALARFSLPRALAWCMQSPDACNRLFEQLGVRGRRAAIFFIRKVTLPD